MNLVAVTSLMIASKYEELEYPKIFNFIKASPTFHSRHAINQMEMKILSYLDFNLNSITINRFLEYFEIACELNEL